MYLVCVFLVADCRNSVRYTSSGDLVYNAAALGIVYHKNTEQQTFLQVHTYRLLPCNHTYMAERGSMDYTQ